MLALKVFDLERAFLALPGGGCALRRWSIHGHERKFLLSIPEFSDLALPNSLPLEKFTDVLDLLKENYAFDTETFKAITARFYF